MRRTNIFSLLMWVIVSLLPVACRSQSGNPPPGDEGGEQETDQLRRVASVGVASPDGEGGDDASSAEDAPSIPPETTPMAVDVGNPTESGPGSGQGRLRFRLADAAIADTAAAVLIRPLALHLLDRAGQVTESVELVPEAINLMDYQGGETYLLVDRDIDVQQLGGVRIELVADQPATLVLPGQSSEPILVPPSADTTRPSLTGDLTIDIADGSAIDATMHIDLRKSLVPVTPSLPAAWLDLWPSARYWLMPEQHTFVSSSVGALVGTGLDSQLTNVGCVYPADVVLIGIDANPDCRDAAGSALVRDGSLYIGYLTPGSYALRLYLVSGLFVDAPGLLTVNANSTTTVDLSSVVEGLIGGILP